MIKKPSAYELGLTGTPLPDSANAWERWRHKRGAKEQLANTAIDLAFEQGYRREFESVAESAEGLNADIRAILRTAAEIPEPKQTPLKGYTMVNEDGTSSKELLRHFSFGEAPKKFHTPLVRQPGILHLDSLNWSHYGFTTPIKTISLYSHTPRNSDGSPKLGETTSTIEINSITYDPDTLRLDSADTFTGAVRLEIDADGEVTQVRRSSSSATGGVIQEQALINTESFLEDLHSAATDTVLAYRMDDFDETPT